MSSSPNRSEARDQSWHVGGESLNWKVWVVRWDLKTRGRQLTLQGEQLSIWQLMTPRVCLAFITQLCSWNGRGSESLLKFLRESWTLKNSGFPSIHLKKKKKRLDSLFWHETSMPCLMLDVRGVLLRRPRVVSPQASEMSPHRLNGLAVRWEWPMASEVREGGLGCDMGSGKGGASTEEPSGKALKLSGWERAPLWVLSLEQEISDWLPVWGKEVRLWILGLLLLSLTLYILVTTSQQSRLLAKCTVIKLHSIFFHYLKDIIKITYECFLKNSHMSVLSKIEKG